MAFLGYTFTALIYIVFGARDGRPAEKVKKFSEQLASALVRAALAPLIARGIGSVVRVFM